MHTQKDDYIRMPVLALSIVILFYYSKPITDFRAEFNETPDWFYLSKNTEQMNAWLEKSTMTVAVLEQALQSILQG